MSGKWRDVWEKIQSRTVSIQRIERVEEDVGFLVGFEYCARNKIRTYKKRTGRGRNY